MFSSRSRHAFKWPHLIDRCKIHELFQCVISNIQARSVCLGKQFIESKLADLALTAAFSRQHGQRRRWMVGLDLPICYILSCMRLIRLSSSSTLITAAFELLREYTHTNTLPRTHTTTYTHTHALKASGLVTHSLITGANLVKTITQLIESCLADECIQHTHTSAHGNTSRGLTATS